MCDLASYNGNSEVAVTSDFYAERNNGLFWMFLLGGILQVTFSKPHLTTIPDDDRWNELHDKLETI